MSRLMRAVQTCFAFLRMGWLLEISYPLSFVTSQLQSFVVVVTYYFVDRLVSAPGSNVAGDYFTFVSIGIVAARVLIAGLNDLSIEVDQTIQQGRMEMLLVEPIRWRFLPFGFVQWPLAVRSVGAVVMVAFTLVMGASYRLAGVPQAILITLLGTLACLAVGTFAMSIKVLSKRSDPILSLYQLASGVLSGVYFPVELLPSPLRLLSRTIPHTYVLAGNRQALMHEGARLGGPSPLEAIVALAIFCVVGFTASLWLLGRTMAYARKVGVLAGY